MHTAHHQPTVTSLPIPLDATVHLVGLTNSTDSAQHMTITLPDGKQLAWSGSGAQANQIVGMTTIAPSGEGVGDLKIALEYEAGEGRKPHKVKVDCSSPNGLANYVVGGQDESQNHAGSSAYSNAFLLIYWAPGT